MARWNEVIPLGEAFDPERNLPFAQQRDLIVQRLRASRWYRRLDLRVEKELKTLLDQLAATTDEEAFDRLWSRIYDLADRDRVWLDGWRTPAEVEAEGL